MHFRLLLVLLPLLLAACAIGEVPWSKPGIAPEQVSSDYATCQRTARANVNQAFGSEASRLDSMAAPPTLSGNSTNMVQDIQRANLAAEGRRRADAETTACMRAKGYLPK